MLKAFSCEELRRFYNELAYHTDSQSAQKGVKRFNSPNPGPVLGITIMTHGNEPTGLAAYGYLSQRILEGNFLLKGSIVFVINNLEASEQFWDSPQKDQLRFIDMDMNRINQSEIRANSLFYEGKRAFELLPVWREFNYALDIHSAISNPESMLIVTENTDRDLINQFPVDVVIENIIKITSFPPAVAYYGAEGQCTSVGIETGCHEDTETYTKAITASLILLERLGMISGERIYEPYPNTKKQRHYRVIGSLLSGDPDLKLVRPFGSFEGVSRGEIIARSSSGVFTAPENCHILFAPKTETPPFPRSEVLFYAVREK